MRLNLIQAFEQRLSWTKAGKHKFIESLQDDGIRSLYYQSTNQIQKMVVLYGKSQSGKTEFILRLLGIPHEFHQTVKQVLRGGQKGGMSSTAVPMSYLASDDDKFHYNVKGEQKGGFTAEQMTKEMAHIRHQMERSNISVEEVIQVYLPKKWVTINLQGELVDLPGTDSHNEVDRNKNLAVQKKFLPIASRILLFTDVTTPSDLIPRSTRDGKTLHPLLFNWFRHPNRYGVVLTHAFSADSNKRILEEKSAQQAIQHVLNEFRRTLNDSLEKERKESIDEEMEIFCLDYGESWMNLDEKYRIKADSEIENQLQKVRQTIENITEFNHFLQEAEYYKDAEKIANGTIERHEKKILLIEADIKRIDADTKATSEYILLQQAKLRELESLRVKHENLENHYFNRIESMVAPSSIPNAKSKLRKNLRSWIDTELCRMESIYVKLYSNVKNDLIEIDDGFEGLSTRKLPKNKRLLPPKDLNKVVSEGKSKLFSKFADRWFFNSVNSEQRNQVLRDMNEEIYAGFKSNARNKRNGWKLNREPIQEEIAQCKLKIKNYKNDIEYQKTHNRIRKLKELNATKQDLDSKRQELNNDIERAKNYKAYMTQAFVEEMRGEQSKHSSMGPEEKLVSAVKMSFWYHAWESLI